MECHLNKDIQILKNKKIEYYDTRKTQLQKPEQLIR